MVETCQSVSDHFERLRTLAHTHNIARLHMIRSDVHHLTVDSDVAVEHQLTGSGAGRSDAQTEHHIVQTAFKKLEKHFAGDTLGAGSLVEKIAEIFLEHTIGIFSLLLLTQLSAILRSLAATVLAVLAGA